MNSIAGLTSQQLHRAADLKERIDALQDELNALLGGGPSRPAAKATGRKKGQMSAEGRANISAATKARWAAYRAKAPAAAPAKKAKREVSAEGRAKMSAAAKERWAKAKKAGKSTL